MLPRGNLTAYAAEAPGNNTGTLGAWGDRLLADGVRLLASRTLERPVHVHVFEALGGEEDRSFELAHCFGDLRCAGSDVSVDVDMDFVLVHEGTLPHSSPQDTEDRTGEISTRRCRFFAARRLILSGFDLCSREVHGPSSVGDTVEGAGVGGGDVSVCAFGHVWCVVFCLDALSHMVFIDRWLVGTKRWGVRRKSNPHVL